jgi:hypothetical protein
MPKSFWWYLLVEHILGDWRYSQDDCKDMTVWEITFIMLNSCRFNISTAWPTNRDQHTRSGSQSHWNWVMRSTQLRGQVSRRLSTQQRMKHWQIPNTSILPLKHNETFGWARVSTDRSLVSVGFLVYCDCFHWLTMALLCTVIIGRYSFYDMLLPIEEPRWSDFLLPKIPISI